MLIKYLFKNFGDKINIAILQNVSHLSAYYVLQNTVGVLLGLKKYMTKTRLVLEEQMKNTSDLSRVQITRMQAANIYIVPC